MTDYGVIPEGFRRKTEDEIIGELQADELADIGADLDVSTESVIGQLNNIFGRQLGIAWENLETCYHAFDPDAAEARLLEMLAKLTGTFRKGSTQSEVTLTCDLDDGTVLTPNEDFAAIEDKDDVRWTPSEVLYPSGYTAVGDGPKEVVFVSELFGPVEGFAGTINIIATPVTGWNSVVNANDAELGKEVDKDPEFRVRREREIAAQGSATVRAIASKVSQAFFEQLETLSVYENDTDSTDVNGMPPHSVEVLIFDGEVPSIDDDELAQVIFDAKAGGIQAYGTTTANAIAIVNGIEKLKPTGFSRADQIEIWLEFDLTKLPGYVGDEAAKQAIALACNERFGPGEQVVASITKGFATALAGVHDVTALRLGTTASPVGTVNIPITLRQTARFSTSRIVINSTNATQP